MKTYGGCPFVMRRLIALFLIPSAFLLLAGCSSQFVYDRIDRLAQFYIERYVDLDREQSSLLKVNLETIKEWHRREELSGYLEFLDRVETDLQAEVTGNTVAAWAVRLQEAYGQVRDHVVPVLIEVAATMSDTQVQEFAANMEKRNRDLEDELLARDDREYREEAYDEMTGRLSNWLGRLEPEQRQSIRQAVDQLERLDRAWLDERRDWQREVITELKREPGWQARLTALAVNRVEYANPQDLETNARNTRRIYTAVAEVLNARTERQRQKLAQRLQQWRRDLAALQAPGKAI
jgi:hypothetical protein